MDREWSETTKKRLRILHRHLCHSVEAEVPLLCESLPNGSLEVTLNRPKNLNCLNFDMISRLDVLVDSIPSKGIQALILKGSTENFCAGGDLKTLVQGIKTTHSYEACYAFFKKEFQLDYKIPTIAFVTGYTMGGGMGLAMGCRYRIGTETLVMGMPETDIGFFPDVGSVSYLIRCPPHPSLGLYYGLTSAKLSLGDALYCRFVTHYIPSDRLESFQTALKQLPVVTTQALDALLEQFQSLDRPTSTIERFVPTIESCFSFDSLEAILAKLGEKASTEKDPVIRKWCKWTLETILTKSPTSLKVAMKALKDSKLWTQEQVYAMDYRLACRMVKSHDFKEGVRAILLEKDRRPKWKPSRIEEVPDEYIHTFFEPFETMEEWTP